MFPETNVWCLQMFWPTTSPKPKYIQLEKSSHPPCFFFSICLVWLYWWFDSHVFQQMEFLFGRRKSPEEMLRQNQRALNRAMRELDRERNKLEQQEKKIIADIKKMAKQGQMVRRKITYKEIICIEIKRENPRGMCVVLIFAGRR